MITCSGPGSLNPRIFSHTGLELVEENVGIQIILAPIFAEAITADGLRPPISGSRVKLPNVWTSGTSSVTNFAIGTVQYSRFLSTRALSPYSLAVRANCKAF